MVTLEQLRRENARLKAEREVREDFRKRDEERRMLSRENKNLKKSNKPSALKRITKIFEPTIVTGPKQKIKSPVKEKVADYDIMRPTENWGGLGGYK